jgi:hypothetical protein
MLKILKNLKGKNAESNLAVDKGKEDSGKESHQLFIGKKGFAEVKKTKNAFLESIGNTKLGKEVIDLGSDLTSSLKELGNGTLASLKSMYKGSKREEKDSTYYYKEQSIANRHKDAISDIINGVTSGNLLDAGLSALKLHNNGTKFNFARAQDVNKDVYNFKYWYLMNGDGMIDNPNELGGTTLQMLDSIEDPTTLGYTLKIDDETSPLFNKSTGIISFINEYKEDYPELDYALSYLEEFKEDIVKILVPPTTIDDNVKSLSVHKKPHYILSISGLDKLDNMFVEYNDSNNSHEALEITLHEDVRMFTNRLSFLYKNLVYSYSMGKRLIPENLLRFNLFIKIADYRNFTANSVGDVNNGYSRVIYELKDCEFIFDSSLNPSSLIIGGFNGANSNFADLKLKIKYKKVNRIFYSKMFGASEFLIGDAHYKPSTEKTKLNLEKSIFSLSEVRASTSNNIDVEPSIQERYNNLKTNGLLREDDNDSAVGRFMKKTTNNLTKKAMQPVDEGIKKLTNKLNNVDIIGKKASIRTALDVLLDNKVALKTGNKELGSIGELGTNEAETDSKIKSDGVIELPNDKKIHTNIVKNKETELGSLHDSVESEINIQPNDLHNTVANDVINPIGDLHNTVANDIINPIGDLHNTIANDTINPIGDLHDEIDHDIINPNGDLHPDTSATEKTELGSLHSKANSDIIIKHNNLHDTVNNDIDMSIDNINTTNTKPIEEPKGVISQPSESIIAMSSSNVNDKVEDAITSPNSVIRKEFSDIIAPNESININIDSDIEKPNDYKHQKTDHKIKQSDKYSNLRDFLKNRKK